MKFIIAIIIVMLLFPISAYAQQPGYSRLDIIQATYSGPVFLEAFWTNRTTPPPAGTSLDKVEVAPGDGVSVLAVTLVNRGFSDITAVNGLLTLPSGFGSAGTGSNQLLATHNNIVSAGNTFTLFFQVDVSDRVRVTEYNALLNVQYSRVLETGTPRTVDVTVPFKVTGRVILDASSTGGVSPGTSGRVSIEITNVGSAPATGVVLTVPGTSGLDPSTQQASIATLGQKTFELGVLQPGSSVTVEPMLYASNASSGTLQAIQLEFSYGNAYGERKNATIPIGIVVLPEVASSLISLTPIQESLIVTAGKITDLRVSLTNNRSQELSDVVVSVTSNSESVRILGNTRWTVGDMNASSEQQLSTTVFAARDMIGRATTFAFTVQHLSAGQPEVEIIELGIYVDGEINIRAYDIGLTYIGGRPNITGNLLNEGNVAALFTTIEVVSAGNLASSLPPQQYIGDLTENSPLPFSIPIEVRPGTGPGTHPVEIRIEYRDSLREPHSRVISSNVNFVPENPMSGNNQNVDAASTIPAIIGIIAAAMAAVFIVRRRKRIKLKQTLQFSKKNGGQDIEAVLDSHLNAPEEKK